MKLQPFPIAKIQARLESRAKEAVNILVPIYMKYLKEGAPVAEVDSKGSAKKISGSIERIKTAHYQLNVRMPDYLYNIAKGVTFAKGGYHYAKAGRFMSFPESKWPMTKNGRGGDPGKNRMFKNGYFNFKRVRFHMRQNDFIGKAITKLKRRSEWRNFGKTIFQDFRGK